MTYMLADPWNRHGGWWSRLMTITHPCCFTSTHVDFVGCRVWNSAPAVGCSGWGRFLWSMELFPCRAWKVTPIRMNRCRQVSAQRRQGSVPWRQGESTDEYNHSSEDGGTETDCYRWTDNSVACDVPEGPRYCWGYRLDNRSGFWICFAGLVVKPFASWIVRNCLKNLLIMGWQQKPRT